MHLLIDSHIHLDHSAFTADRSEVVARARTNGVEVLVIPAVDRSSWTRIRQLCATDRHVYPAYGLHPLFIDDRASTDVHALSAWLDAGDAVAIGEIGLDFHAESSDRETQRHYFKAQLQLARERDFPVIVHGRSAFEEVILTIRQTGGLHGVVHSFSGSQEQARRLWDMGFCLGIGGPVTYDRAHKLRRIVANMPPEFLLLESDAPDQPDSGIRGQRNEPARVSAIAQCVAELRGESLTAIAAATTANACRLFGIDNPRC